MFVWFWAKSVAVSIVCMFNKTGCLESSMTLIRWKKNVGTGTSVQNPENKAPFQKYTM